MKKIVITLAAIANSISAIAQITSGRASYKETIKLDIQLDGEAAQYAEMLPKEQLSEKILHFSPEASLYKSAPKREDPAPGGVRRIVIDGSGSDEIVYRDLAEQTVVAQKDFMTRKFLVTGATKKINWKMTGKQQTILGYACQEAIAEADSQKITAWYAPSIPVATGPGEFGGLPGLILEVKVGEMHTVTATEVVAGEQDKKSLARPTEGKKMDRGQYEAMVMEKMKEMQEQEGGAGGGRNVIIKVQH